MKNKQVQSNYVRIVGTINSSLKFSHEMFGEKFYEFFMTVPRLSENEDELPIVISERLIDSIDMEEGKSIIVEGQFRSYNRYEESTNKLLLRIFVREVKVPNEDEIDEAYKNPNEVLLNGFLCKGTKYRTTPFGRQITDMLIAVNRPYNKSDYIPCIAWGRNAKYCEKLKVGDHVKVWGRIQSRNYHKRFDDGTQETRVAYEVSIAKFEHFKNENNRRQNEDSYCEKKTSDF